MIRTRGRRTCAALAALVASAFVVGGCGNPVDLVTGGDPIQDYCGRLTRDRQELAVMVDQGSPTALVRNLPMLRDLAHHAPDDIADDWQVFVTAIAGLEEALHRAGVKPAQFHDGRPPAGLSAAHRRAIADAADRLSADRTVAAASTIEQEARDVCKVNLGM